MTQRIEGDGNVVAGRDIHLQIGQFVQSLYNDLLKPAFVRIDERVTAIFPERLQKATSPGILVDFSSQKLFESLTQLGIPLAVAFFVVEHTEQELRKLSQTHKQLTTDDIRVAVAHILYHHEAMPVPGSRQEFWGDAYVRRYGNPNQHIQVLLSDGAFHDLNYNYIRENIIPELISSVWQIVNFEHLRHAIPEQEIQDMAAEILAVIRNLNLYRIHHSSLLTIARELALQPPHPWMVCNAYQYDAIRYDYERAEKHIADAKRALLEDDYDLSIYNMRECLHHASSALLAFYGFYMGCNYLSPLHNLHHIITLIINEKPLEARYHSSRDIQHDLASVGLSLHALSRVVSNARGCIPTTPAHPRERIAEAVATAEELWMSINSLLAEYMLVEKTRHNIEYAGADEATYSQCVMAVFSIMPGMRLDRRNPSRLWLSHDLATYGLGSIHSRILLMPLYDCSPSGIKSAVNASIQYIRIPTLSNCVLVVSLTGQAIEIARDDIQLLSDRGIVLSVVSMTTLLGAYQSVNPKQSMADMIIDGIAEIPND